MIPLRQISGAALLAVLSAALTAAPISVSIKDDKGQPVADAVVSLAALDPAAAAPARAATGIEITQRNQEFLPYVTVVPVGTSVSFPNGDTVQHHVYSLSKAKRFEFPRYDPGKREAIVFDAPGVVALGCNIHDWMLAYLVVVPTNWFAKSDADGAATIEVPAGRYRLELWHPRLAGPETREIVVAATAPPQAFALKLKPERRIHRPPVAGGGDSYK